MRDKYVLLETIELAARYSAVPNVSTEGGVYGRLYKACPSRTGPLPRRRRSCDPGRPEVSRCGGCDGLCRSVSACHGLCRSVTAAGGGPRTTAAGVVEILVGLPGTLTNSAIAALVGRCWSCDVSQRVGTTRIEKPNKYNARRQRAACSTWREL